LLSSPGLEGEFPIGTRRGVGSLKGCQKQESLSSPPSQGEFPIQGKGVGSMEEREWDPSRVLWEMESISSPAIPR